MLKTRQAYPTTTAVSAKTRMWAVVAAVVAASAAAGLLVLGPHPAAASVQQAWPPFALVTGLLLIGLVAASDGVFEAAGVRIARIRGGPAVLLAASLGLTALVTAVLNLDTAVVFLTPVMIQTARARGLNERPFVYGTVFMSNSASLLLVGSNLTNLLVVDGARLSGFDFARTMLVPWVVSVMLTWLVFSIIQRRQPRATSVGRPVTLPRHGRAGVTAVAAAAALVVALPDPSVAVLVLGVVVAAWQRLRGRVDTASVLRTTPPALVGIFVVAVCFGALARLWVAPAMLLTTAARPAVVVLGALGAAAINNLPAASLLSAQPPAHPFFLLLGLNLGPNLAITGSLSAILWLRLARENGAEASIWTYSRLGLVIAPLQLAGAAAALALLNPAA